MTTVSATFDACTEFTCTLEGPNQTAISSDPMTVVANPENAGSRVGYKAVP